MFSPAPSSMVASMNKYQRWVFAVSLVWVLVYNTLLRNDLHVQTRGELMEKTGLSLLQRIRDPHFLSSFEDGPRSYGHFREANVWLRKGYGVEG